MAGGNVETGIQHNHEAEVRENTLQDFRRGLCQRSAAEPSVPLREIYDEEARR